MGVQVVDNLECRVVTWNVGRDRDYFEVSRRAKFTVPDDNAAFFAMRDGLFQATFRQMIEGHNPDFFCLQESDANTDRVKGWIGHHYKVISDGGDSAIAWNDQRYELVEDSIRYPGTSPLHFSIVADFIDRQTQFKVTIASAHIKGFDLANPKEQTESGKDVAAQGDKELREVFKSLESATSALRILGMDANSTLKIHPDRLKIAKQKGFKRVEKDNLATAYNPTLAAQAAKIDFLFAKTSKRTQLSFQKNPTLKIPIESPKLNPSDHRPVISTVKVRH
jgi:hypothetical protein